MTRPSAAGIKAPNDTYIDTRPNLAALPEARQYQAQYLVGDDPIGNLSPTILNVTVPG